MTQNSHPLWKVWHWKMHWQVLLGMALGCLFGYLSGKASGGQQDGADFVFYALVGKLFMNALKMLVVPLVMSSIIHAMGSLGQRSGFAKLGMKTLGYYACTSLAAILIGLVMVNLIQPGEGSSIETAEISTAVNTEGSTEASKLAHLKSRTDGKGLDSMLNIFLELVPSNIIKAMVETKMLGLIVFSLLFGIFMNRLKDDHRVPLLNVVGAIQDVMIHMTFFVLRFLPLGVACLIAKTTAETVSSGNVLERLSQLSLFAITTVIALSIHAFGVMPAILAIIGRIDPRKHFRAMNEAILTAFSTASSSATLPLTINNIEKNAKVSKRVSSFVLPVGATVNMDGTALYECVAVMFLAQLYGVEMNMAAQFVVVAVALLTSIGVAGIPSASLVAIVIVLNSVNDILPDGQSIPMEALAIILIFDRLLDMCRTAVNVLGDSVGTAVIAVTEGETDLYPEAEVTETAEKT